MEEKKNVAREEKANEAKSAAQVTVNDDEYNVSAFDENDDISVVSHSNENTYRTKYTIQKTNVMVASGQIKENYAVAYITKIGGQDYKSVLRIRPSRKGGTSLEEIAKLIMSLPVEHKLEIVERTTTSDRGTTKTYSMRMSCLTDDGITYTCPLEPVGVSDRAIWENFRRQIFARGDYEKIANNETQA